MSLVETAADVGKADVAADGFGAASITIIGEAGFGFKYRSGAARNFCAHPSQQK